MRKTQIIKHPIHVGCTSRSRRPQKLSDPGHPPETALIGPFVLGSLPNKTPVLALLILTAVKSNIGAGDVGGGNKVVATRAPGSGVTSYVGSATSGSVAAGIALLRNSAAEVEGAGS